LVNYTETKFLVELLSLSTSWLCLSLQGRTEAFGELVNEKANIHKGQAQIAKFIRTLLQQENYSPKPLEKITVEKSETQEMIQDKYSLRCTPQVLGPVWDTLETTSQWLQEEMNGTSDNPLIDEDGSLANGGNFYGGYLSQGMDYVKISIAHCADLLDRQLMTLVDEKTNRGLPSNLANWNAMNEEERFLHHGLKGLHQAVGAITSEILARATPNGIFSRSSESHNQDKVSLGMSASVQCAQMIEPLFTIQSMYLICLAQALDLRGVRLQGTTSKYYYDLVRSVVPFVDRDQSLGEKVKILKEKLKRLAHERESALG
jgi:histidine ammonia-lyase/phenylalanine ammonia-lyase